MADFSKVLDTINKQREAYDQFKTNKEGRMNQLKQDFGYDDRIKSIDSTRKSILDAESMLSNLPKNIRQRTAGRLMTAGQLARLQSRESRGLSENLSNFARNLDVGERGLSDVRTTLDREADSLWRAYSASTDNLRNERETYFNKYLSDVNSEQQQRQRDLQAKIAAANERIAQSQAATQMRIAEINDRYNREAMARQEQREKEAYDRYLAQQAADKKNALGAAKSNYVQTDPVNINPLDMLGLGFGVPGSENKLKKWEAQEDDKNAYLRAINFMQENYDKGADYSRNILNQTNNPYAYLVDQYY